MNGLATILIVEDEPFTLAAVRLLLSREGEFRIETAADGREGWERAQALLPDLIVSDLSMPEMDGLELCRLVKADPVTAGTMFVMLTAHNDTGHKVEGLDAGVDDFMAKPAEPAEFIAKIRAMLRIKGLHDRLRANQHSLALLNEQLEESFDQLLHLLVHFLDLRVPGAAARGWRIAAFARRLAERLEVPVEFHAEMLMAAHVFEIGRIGEPERGAGAYSGVGGEPWRYLLDSAVILQQVERLRPVAELVAAIGENWDGTGLPRHQRMGQIPLRVRMLRVVIDFFAALERPGGPGTPKEALERIARHSGTRFDPLVVAQLAAVLAETPGEEFSSGKRHVAVEDLAEGMVLADDLVTSSGVKLLAQGCTLTKATRNIIVRRHEIDPIVYGAWVRR